MKKIIIRKLNEIDARILTDGREVGKITSDYEILDTSLQVKYKNLTGVEMVESNGRKWTFSPDDKQGYIFLDKSFTHKDYLSSFLSLRIKLKRGEDIKKAYEKLTRMGKKSKTRKNTLV
jgi:hypothetical protein